jgi:hypothetical protein
VTANTVIAGNTTSANGGAGVSLLGSSLFDVTGTLLAGNRVGTDATGTVALPNRPADGHGHRPGRRHLPLLRRGRSHPRLSGPAQRPASSRWRTAMARSPVRS